MSKEPLAIIWTKRSVRRLDQIGHYIALENPAAAVEVVARIATAGNTLAELPHLGRPGRIIGTRELVISGLPYIMPYRLKGQSIEILTVIHTAQKWPDRL
jgi:toxin ParE1/3/4